MFVLLPRLFRLCRFVRLVRQIEQVRVVAKLYRCRNDLTRASGPAGRLGRDRGSFQQSDETAGILKQLKDRMSADLTAFLEKGVGSDDQSPGSCEKPRRRRQPRWRRLLKPKEKPKRGHHLGETRKQTEQAAVEQKKQLDKRSKRNEPRKRRFNVVACTLARRRKAAIQERVKKFHLCLHPPQQYQKHHAHAAEELKRSFESSLREKSMNVSVCESD